MIRLPPRSTRTDTSFPTRRSSELPVSDHATGCLDAGYREALVDALQKLEILRQPHPQGAQILLGLPWREFDHERSEEHTSELQSLMRSSYAVFCLKKKKLVIQVTQYKYA